VLDRRRRRRREKTSQGWIPVGLLSKMIGLDQSHLNIQIFRARTQLAQALSDIFVSSTVIERRRGDVRLGSFRFQIFRGSILEGEFNPYCQLAMSANDNGEYSTNDRSAVLGHDLPRHFSPDGMREFKQQQDENVRLKKVKELSLDKTDFEGSRPKRREGPRRSRK
jgi:hypothetical protein